MLAAGGTGGHLYPAFALAQELGRRDIPVDLVTDMRGDRYGANFPARAVYRVPSATLAGRSPVAAVRTASMLARGIVASYSLLGTVKPGAVVGFGGYPAFPPILAATLRGIPTALHEQNAVLGRANRLLSRRVTTIATSFENTKYLSGGALRRARLTGNPVRDRWSIGPRRAIACRALPGPTRCWCSAAARARVSSPMRCRRP
jgi:UDP-N-acetylglucosamine--N-acetylmuramyl-(pentapeptide) pyrophosphoryl-undecaprenol N-acetylglucosamine transferase